MKKCSHLIHALAFLLGAMTCNVTSTMATVVDWTSFSNPFGTSSVTGNLGSTGITATISGTGGSARIFAPTSVINNSYNWSGSAYTPNVSNTDALYFENTVANAVDTWTFNFSSAVVNPYFHFYGLERTYTFGGPITLLSASTTTFVLTSNSITGHGFTPNNAAGTLQVLGTFTSLQIVGTGGPGIGHNRDAVLIQVGATPFVVPDPDPEPDPDPPTPVPEPSTLLLFVAGLATVGYGRRKFRRR